MEFCGFCCAPKKKLGLAFEEAKDAGWDQDERGYMDFKAQHELTAARERAQHAWLHQSVVDAGAAALGLPLRSSGGQLRMFPGVRTRRRLVERPAQPRADDDAVQRDRALGDAPRQGRRAARGRLLVGWSRPRVRGRDRVRDLSTTNEGTTEGARERPHPRRRGITRRGFIDMVTGSGRTPSPKAAG